MSVIGLDLGTTRVKALLHDTVRDDLRVVAAPTPIITSVDGDLRDAEEIVRVAADCIARLVSDLTDAERGRIEGISIASLSEEMVLVDECGLSIAAMPTWYATVMRDESHRAGLNPSFSWSKLRWARERLDAASSERVRGTTSLAGYVAARLAQATTLSMEFSHASRTGFFDVARGCWDEETFAASGWSVSILPELVPSGTPLGEIAAEPSAAWGIPAQAVVAVAGHDHFCGAFAAGVRSSGQIFLSSGTSEAHVLIVDDIEGLDLPEHIQVGRFVDGRSFYLHAHLPSGHLHGHLEQLVGGRDRLAELEEQALSEPVGADGLEFVPSVGADPGYRVRGLSAHAGAASFVRAAQEGLAFAAQELDESLVKRAGTSASLIVATGAATTNTLWIRIRSAVGIAPLEAVQESELTALGAAQVFRAVALAQHTDPAPRWRIDGDPADADAYRRLRDSRTRTADTASDLRGEP